MHTLQRTTLASALALGLGTTITAIPTTASAALITADWTGLYTHLNTSDNPFFNTSYPYSDDPTWGYGRRTPISGTLSYNTSTGAGTVSVNSFDFGSAGPANFHDFTLQAIGDGTGGSGTLLAASLLWDWNGNPSMSASIILDAAGFFGAGAVGTSATISGTGATPASNNSPPLASYPVGPSPIATTTWNTNFNNDPTCVASNSCLAGNDTIGGSPMDNGPWIDFSVNFDFTSIHITSVSSVPVPAAAWLFGSGLLGLLGVSRTRKNA
jgi:hypothetical protein